MCILNHNLTRCHTYLYYYTAIYYYPECAKQYFIRYRFSCSSNTNLYAP